MTTTLIKIFKSLHIALIAVLFIFFTNCTDDSIATTLKINCADNYDFTELKSSKDTRGNFEMKIPSSWKKEFFVNPNETRLYFADTTRQLDETFIIDIGLYFSKTTIDSKFIAKQKEQIQQNKNIELIKENQISFQDKEGFALQTTSTNWDLKRNSVKLFLNNTNNSYYIIKIDTYGNKNTEEKLCEALQLLNHAELR